MSVARRLRLALLLCTLLGCAAHAAWGFDADELQHLHFAWNMRQGLVPFRDFFEHHPPLFHLLLWPLAGGRAEIDWPLLVSLRLCAFVVTLAALALFYRLARLRLNEVESLWAVVVLYTMHPFGIRLFEFRADWIALALLMACCLLLLRSEERGRPPAALGAGLLAGVAVCLTQKSLGMAPPMALWLAGIAIAAPDSAARRTRMAAFVAFAGATCVAPGLLYAWHHRLGAGAAFLNDVLWINMRWEREVGWRLAVQESLLGSVPVVAVALAEAAFAAARARRHLREAAPEGLLALVLAAGVVALVKTPVPFAQSYIFMVFPWAVCLAAFAVKAVADQPQELGPRRGYLAAGVVACLLVLSPVNALVAVVGWGLLWAACRRALRPAGPRQVSRWLAGFSAFAAPVFLGHCIDSFLRHEATGQFAFVRFVRGHVAAGEPVLTPWPLLLPFHPQPTEHGFARHGIIETVGRRTLTSEYVTCIAAGRVRAALVDEREMTKRMPDFERFLRAHGTVATGAPATRDHQPTLFLFQPAGGRVSPPIARPLEPNAR